MFATDTKCMLCPDEAVAFTPWGLPVCADHAASYNASAPERTVPRLELTGLRGVR